MALKSQINQIFFKYYNNNPALRRIVVTHSIQVANKAIAICKKKKFKIKKEDIYIAALIHDIGVIKCWAPDIHAFGSKPYLQHGIEGEKILKKHNLDKFASICSTHTGAGISSQDVIKNNLPLPPKDFIPKTLLEQLICYSDKFFSKSNDLEKEKPIETVMAQMKKFGEDSFLRFLKLHHRFD